MPNPAATVILLSKKAKAEGRSFKEEMAAYNALTRDEKDTLILLLEGEEEGDIYEEEAAAASASEDTIDEAKSTAGTSATATAAKQTVEAKRSAQLVEDERKATVNNVSLFTRAAEEDAATRGSRVEDGTATAADFNSAVVNSLFGTSTNTINDQLPDFNQQFHNLVINRSGSDSAGATVFSGLSDPIVGGSYEANLLRAVRKELASGGITMQEAIETVKVATGNSAEEIEDLLGLPEHNFAKVDFAGVNVGVQSTYQEVAYVDKLSAYFPPTEPEKLIKLPRLVRYAEGGLAEDEEPVFIIDALIWVQGVEISQYLRAEIQVTLNGTGGVNEASFTLDNSDDRFIWTEHNLVSIYGESALRANAPFINSFAKNNNDMLRQRTADKLDLLRGIEEGFANQNDALDFAEEYGSKSSGVSARVLLQEMRARAFNQNEEIKKEIFAYKADPKRNPPIRNPKNTLNFARYDLVPGRCIFNRMDPIRIFTLYPFRVPGKKYEGDEGRPELWMPEFTGYIENVSIDDDNVRGGSSITVDCNCSRQAIFRRMRLSNDLTSGLTAPLDSLGFAIQKDTFSGQSSPQTAEAQTLQAGFQKNTEGYYNIDNTLFYDDIVTTIYNQPLPNKPLEGALREILVPIEPITVEKNNRGVRGVKFGGNFFYDALNWSQDESRKFLESWHKFCLFGPKRRPWTREEVDEVGRGTTTDGPYAPNKIRLWFLLPRGGSGPKNLADVSTVSIAMNHEVQWTNRQEIIDKFASSIDYNFMVAPTGDLICEFMQADFRPEDYGEFRDTFRVSSNLISSQFGDEQDIPPAGLIVSRGMAAAAGASDDITATAYLRTFVYSPYIAARYGIEIEQDSLPFLQFSDNVLAQQRSVMMYQRLLAATHALNMEMGYRPFILPNRPIHHLPRYRIGAALSVSKSISVGQQPMSKVSVGLQHVRLFSGHYRSAQDFKDLNDVQRRDLSTKGQDPDNFAQLAGLDSLTSADSLERQIFSTVCGGESTPTSVRVPWGPIPDDPEAIAILAPASGIYIIDLGKVKPKPRTIPAPADVQEAAAVGDAVTPATSSECEEVRGASDALPDEPPDNLRVFARDPLDSMSVRSEYGCRTHPTTKKPDFHAGTDLVASAGTIVYAVADGVMTASTGRTEPNLGLKALLGTSTGETVWYGHLSEVLVVAGQSVKAGDPIGKVGATGRATGAHLHFITAAKVGGKAKNVNPRWFLPGLSRPAQGTS